MRASQYFWEHLSILSFQRGFDLKENTHSVILSTLLKDISESEIKPETDICAAAGKFFFHTITKLSPFY